MFKGRKRSRGFTLIELVIVIIILGILAAVAVPKFVDIAATAKESATKGSLGALRSAVTLFYASTATTGNARLPSSTVELRDSLQGPVPVNQAATALVAPANSVITLNAVPQTTCGWTYDSVAGRVYAGNNSEW